MGSATPPARVDILLLEDNAGDARLLAEYLEEGMPWRWRLTRCSRLQEALASLVDRRFDVALVDLSLPDSTGIGTYLDLRSRAIDLPIVILTGLDDQRVARQAMQSGAQDWLPKHGLEATRLARAICYAIERKQWEETVRVREERINRIEKMEAIGRLSDGLAHNFNNILTAVLGNCELLGPLIQHDPRSVRHLEGIRQAAQRATALTRQLMSFCRKQPLDAQPVALDHLARRFEGLVRGALDPGTALVLQAGAGEAAVFADAAQLEQAVLNLALNAREVLAGRGRVVIETGVAELDGARPGFPDSVPSGRWAVLSVTDDGPGIAADILAHVFEPFFSTKDGGKGQGLGLATVHGIVRQHRGCVQVETVPDHGTRFALWLPRVPDGAPRARPSGRRSTRGLETVLLVEDEPQICAVLAEALAAHGYRILVAGGGAEALELFRQNATSIQAVVTDVDMPGIGGYDLARRLKDLRRDVRVIFISGFAEEQVLPEREDGIVSAFLPKPFSAASLARTIRDVMARTA